MKNLEKLTKEEKEMLLKFPSYISILAANNDGELDEIEKKSAIKFSHMKTYSCDPLLDEFYEEVEKVFKQNILELDDQLPKEKQARENAIKKDLEKLEPILKKLDKHYVMTMHKSMKSFKDHVSKAHRNILDYFLFPVSIKGITD